MAAAPQAISRHTIGACFQEIGAFKSDSRPSQPVPMRRKIKSGND